MIQFTYNGVIYNVANHATLEDRLKQRELLQLPLEGWKELLTAVNGKADIEALRQVLTAKVQDIEDSKEFEYKGKKLWWDSNKRANFINLTNSTTENISVVIDNEIESFDPTKLKNLLSKLEVYSSKCYIVTYEHLKNIKQLRTIEDILNYNYTLGYPNKIIED